ncbi:hypothetical protein GT370_07265 [Acidocella sp. MX-AZ03]|nr:hypothetical protein [Acidocella sp. MX-AZ03]WBO60562.1 hypothetical protein GT370_07265 [Acidocella sp. MX-AZ03]
MKAFLRALCCDEAGIPDEANVVFFVATATLVAGAFLESFGRQFPLGEFAAAICALIPLYRAARGDWRGVSSAATEARGNSSPDASSEKDKP